MESPSKYFEGIFGQAVDEWEGLILLKKFPTLGCCGLDCGLCPSYYTNGPSRCPGCCGEDFFNKHPSCSFITCCVKKRNLEVCAECEEFPCDKFDNAEEGPDFKTTSKRVMYNQNYTKEQGLDKFIEQQGKRISILQAMLGHYNEERSKTYYCLAATLLPLNSLNEALEKVEQQIKENSISEEDFKSKAKILKGILNEIASAENEELKLRKKK